jgi:hypothetical protein
LRRWRQKGIGPAYFKDQTGHVYYKRADVERYLDELAERTTP